MSPQRLPLQSSKSIENIADVHENENEIVANLSDTGKHSLL